MSIRVCCASIPLAAEYSPFSIEALPEGNSGLRERVGASLVGLCSAVQPCAIPDMFRLVIGGPERFLSRRAVRVGSGAYWPVALPTELAARPSSVSIDWIARWVVS